MSMRFPVVVLVAMAQVLVLAAPAVPLQGMPAEAAQSGDPIVTTHDGRRLRLSALGCVALRAQAEIEAEWRRAYRPGELVAHPLRPVAEPAFATLFAAQCAA